MTKFQANLHLRKQCNERATLNEVVKIDYEKVDTRPYGFYVTTHSTNSVQFGPRSVHLTLHDDSSPSLSFISFLFSPFFSLSPFPPSLFSFFPHFFSFCSRQDEPPVGRASRPSSSLKRRTSLTARTSPERDFVPRSGSRTGTPGLPSGRSSPGLSTGRGGAPGLNSNSGRNSPGSSTGRIGTSGRLPSRRAASTLQSLLSSGNSPPGTSTRDKQPVPTKPTVTHGMRGKSKKKRPVENSFLISLELESVAQALSVSIQETSHPPLSPIRPFSMFANSDRFHEIVQFVPFKHGVSGMRFACDAHDQLMSEVRTCVERLLPDGYQASFPPYSPRSPASGAPIDTVSALCLCL